MCISLQLVTVVQCVPVHVPVVITACHPVVCPLYLEPSLTLHNVLSVCEGVTDWRGLGGWLNVLDSKCDDICRRYQTASERVEAVVKEWRAHHPAPSWKGLARTLYGMGEVRALRRLYGKYLTGMSCDLMSLQYSIIVGLCVQLGLCVVGIIYVNLHMTRIKTFRKNC